MSLFRRKDSPNWWIELTAPDGRRIQQSTGTSEKVAAQELHDRLKTQFWNEKRLGIKPNRTWQETVLRWLSEQANKASIETDKSHLRWLDGCLAGKYLSQIDRDLISQITVARGLPYEIARTKGRPRQITPKTSTVNRTLEVLRAILRRARDDWGWIDQCPNIPMLKEPIKRVSWITREQALALLNALPDHQRQMVRFALETGLRRKNVTHLAWSQVDLIKRQAWIHPDQAKAGKAIGVPLSNEAMQVLRQQVGKNENWVFPYRGKPVTQVATKSWRNALAKAGISAGFRWHDLRHTWASWHAQDGTPLNVLRELGGWATSEMVQRYAHLSTEHLAQWVNRRTGVGMEIT
ncbi:tyrosine-type recombinase/integrase [Undibacterium oligocarboniphilum]|uniref:Tyrosine-type recombinase/integrase n=1 Tax=Undibacterium oligocarboniphilum TaxID=666702 RepID=A0A850QNE5_9BURK|nr:site-specific integrase [Undibacterium oligocarboniphilum]MBC3871219.1 tyrosine-type recombinase/integrase [Undibacterium oligocarboniphilum]NVO79195.1 tyrosine-type recombinase/integrase [Undibacterium oligocarboniphilum]